ncbi:MAG: hypothetical protein HY926_09730 [Elusimicrobia bacterium]|nr:hypothetical protein [Elusimicrobiota bacterium]
MSAFSEELRRCRELAGHPSAREFFKSAGGRGAVRCTYKQYLNIEAGRSLPKPPVLGALVAQLQVWKQPEQAHRFFRAYLETLLGPGELLELCLQSLGPGARPPSSASSPLRKALSRSLQAKLAPLSPEQSRLIRKDPAHYWTWHVLSGDRADWRPESVAEVLRLPLPQVRRALEDLRRAGLAERGPSGEYGSPYRERHAVHERHSAPARLEVPPYREQVKRLWEAPGRGQTLLWHYLFLRASESELRHYFPYLAQVVSGSEIYDTTEKGPDTSFLVVEASVRRLMPF